MQTELSNMQSETKKHLPLENDEIQNSKKLLEEQLTAVNEILNSYPRTKEWVVSEETVKKDQLKSRYTINAFNAVIGRAQLVIEVVKEIQFNFNIYIIDYLYQKLLTGIKEIQTNIRHLGNEYLSKIPQSIMSKYANQQPVWFNMILTRGAYQLAVKELAEIRNIDKNDIPKMEQLLTEVKNDFEPLHTAYKKDLMDPQNGCATTDEMVDDLEELVREMSSTLLEVLDGLEEKPIKQIKLAS